MVMFYLTDLTFDWFGPLVTLYQYLIGYAIRGFYCSYTISHQQFRDVLGFFSQDLLLPSFGSDAVRHRDVDVC